MATKHVISVSGGKDSTAVLLLAFCIHMSKTTPQKPYTPPSNSYQGTELKPHPGLPASRFYAFTLPSRVGGHLYYPAPARRVEPFPA